MGGAPKIINFHTIFHEINHPAIGVPLKTPPERWESAGGLHRPEASWPCRLRKNAGRV